MGVMSCSRKGCDNIMCDTYVDSVGYVCYECQGEFKEYLEVKGKEDLTEGEIERELKNFMTTEKDEYTQGKVMDVDTFFKEYTRDN